MRLKSSVFGCLIVLHAGVFAGSASWINPMDGDWSHDSNWTDLSIPNSPTDSATFPNVLENSQIMVTVDESYDVGSLNFTDPDESGYFITATGGGVLHLYDSISVSTGQPWSSRIDSPLVLENTISISTTEGSGLQFTTGGITGSGGITLMGNSAIDFGTATNTYSGTTTIISGMFQAGQSNVFSPYSPFVLADADGAVLDVNAGDNTIKSLSGGGSNGGVVLIGSGNTLTLGNDTPSLTFAGKILDEYGAGSIIKQGSGEWVVTGANSYSGTTTLSAGQITLGNNTAIGSGTLAMADATTLGLNNGVTAGNDVTLTGTCSISVASGTAGLSGPIGNGTSTGSLVKTGLGTLKLSGSNTYTGNTTIAEGNLSISGSSASPLAISSGAILRGAGSFGPITIADGAVLAPGNSVGTITTSSVTFNPTSIFQVEINPAEASSLIVTGLATLAGNVEVVLDPGSYQRQNEYLVLNATSTSGSFNSTVLEGRRGFNFSLNQVGNTVHLEYYVPPISTGGLTGNAAKVANYLNDKGDVEELVLFNTLSGNTLTSALSSITPSRNAFGAFITAQTAFSVSNLVATHMDSFRASRKDSSEEPFVSVLTADASEQIAAPVKSRGPKNRFSSWLSGFGQFAHLSAISQNPSFNYISGGILAGLDYLGENRGVVGGSLGYGHTHYYDEQNAGHGNINAYFGSIYGNAFLDSFYFSPAVWGIFNQIDNTRNISFPEFSAKAHSDIFSWQLVPHLEVGYDFAFSWGDLIPFTSADWAISWQRGYQEHGASPFNAKQKANNSSMVRSETGLKFLEKWEKSWGAFILEEKASYVFEKPFGTGTVNTSFVGTPGSFTVVAVNRNLNLGVVGLNFLVAVGKENPIKVNLGYEGEFGANFWSNDVTLTLTKDF